MNAILLPLPPSVNHYWRSVPATRSHRARVMISENGRRFKAACRLAALAQFRVPLEGELAIRGVVFFQDRRRDLDNILKPLLDALQGAAYINDRQIVHIELTRRIDKRRPRVELVVQPYDAE